MTNGMSKMVTKREKEPRQFNYTDLNKNTIQLLLLEIHRLNIKMKNTSQKKKQDFIDILKQYYFEKKSKDCIYKFIMKYKTLFLQRVYKRLKGDCLTYKNKCVNETDFYTLEPLENIPDNQFYCFEEKGFYYGFNIFSFQHLLSTDLGYGYRKPCFNPYTREPVSVNMQTKISRLINLVKLTEPNITDINKEPISSVPSSNEVVVVVRHDNLRFLGNSIYPRRNLLNPQQVAMVEMLIQKRNNSIDTRIEQLFYEIDLLGNYTQRSWFDELEKIDYIRFFNILKDFWYNNVQTRHDICYITGDPFYNICISRNFQAYSIEQLREACLLVMENLTFTGKDDVSRKTGVIYILLHLAHVSENVRNAINWLN